MSGQPVERVFGRGAGWIAGIAVVSLLAAGYLLLTPGEVATGNGVDPDGYSRSAIGHHGLLALLRDLGEPVLQLRSSRSVEGAGLLVLAEPRDLGDLDHILALVDASAATLLVLPKRRGIADPARPSWVASTELLPVDEVARVARDLPFGFGAGFAPVRTSEPGAWQVFARLPAPVLPGPIQLLTPDADLRPMIECDQGVLLGMIDDIVVLSDPDLIANHGLVRGDNARLVVGILHQLRGRGAIVFDETLHGHRLEPSIWHALGRFPLVLVTVQLLLLAGLAALAARGRFGPPLPPVAAIADGKSFLIDNVAALLGRGGHHGISVRRYGRLRVRRAAAMLHAPPGLDEGARSWLLARITADGHREELDELLTRQPAALSPREAVIRARRLRQLTERIMHAG